jgi:hypothetical protein
VLHAAGVGSLGAGDLDEPTAEHKRTDFFTLGDFALSERGVLNHLRTATNIGSRLPTAMGFGWIR